LAHVDLLRRRHIRDYRKAASGSTLGQDALDLIQADSIVGAVIQHGRARRLGGRNLLRMLNCTTILQISGDLLLLRENVR